MCHFFLFFLTCSLHKHDNFTFKTLLTQQQGGGLLKVKWKLYHTTPYLQLFMYVSCLNNFSQNPSGSDFSNKCKWTQVTWSDLGESLQCTGGIMLSLKSVLITNKKGQKQNNNWAYTCHKFQIWHCLQLLPLYEVQISLTSSDCKLLVEKLQKPWSAFSSSNPAV